MDRILTNEELEKLNSTDGIIELLCGGDKFDSLSEEEKQDLIYHTLNINLISDLQIKRNLRRSRNDNNLALLDKRRLIALSLLYFGEKDKKGRYVTYTCPYTDTVYNISDVERELEKPQSEKDSSKRYTNIRT